MKKSKAAEKGERININKEIMPRIDSVAISKSEGIMNIVYHNELNDDIKENVCFDTSKIRIMEQFKNFAFKW